MAVSGGPDSLALLLLACEAMPGGVEAVTIDHGLRSESVRECAHVARICTSIGVRHETITVEVTDRNVQSGARRARYAALGEWAARNNLAAIATGHHADDQAETVLMRLNRGSGLSGLAGVRPARLLKNGRTRIIRPLLDWRKADLVAICAASAFEAIDDPSNRNVDFDRTAMRKNLTQANWLDPAAIALSAAHLAAAESYLNAKLDTAWAGRVSLESDATRCTYKSSASRFENTELVSRILDLLGATVRKSEVATMVLRLERGENASLGGILGTARNAGGEWQFTAEPARRNR